MAWWKEFQDLSIKHLIKLILHENDVKLSKFKRSLVKIKRRKFKIYVDLWYVWSATFWLLIREINTSTKTMEWLNSFSIVNLMLQEITCQSFLFFSKFVWFSYFFPNIWSPIVCRKKFFCYTKHKTFA